MLTSYSKPVNLASTNRNYLMNTTAQEILHSYMAQNGSKGGKSRSKDKLEAVRANLEKARASRWPKKKTKPANG